MESLRQDVRTVFVAVVAVALTAGGPAIAHGVQHALFAHNADKVDGKHAVGAGASIAARKGRLVATDPTTGRLPNNLIAKALDSGKLGGLPAAHFMQDGSTAGGDLQGTYPDPTLRPPEDWTEVQPAVVDLNGCAPGSFCGEAGGGGFAAWENYGGPYSTAGYYKDPFGVVHLKGLVRLDDFTPEAIFVLPSGYRPQTIRIFPVIGSTRGGGSNAWNVVAGRIDVYPTGAVGLVRACATATTTICSADAYDNDGGYLSLEGISFRTDG